MSTKGPCAYCGEWFGSISAYDRHLLIRRETVTTKRGHLVPNEEVITCRPVSEFGKLNRAGKPRLVPTTDAAGRTVWVTKRRSDTAPRRQEARKPPRGTQVPNRAPNGLDGRTA